MHVLEQIIIIITNLFLYSKVWYERGSQSKNWVWLIIKQKAYFVVSIFITCIFKYIWYFFIKYVSLSTAFLAHLAKDNVSFCHHLAFVVRRLLTFHILIFSSETLQPNELKLDRKRRSSIKFANFVPIH
jgi:hypothetical protein